MDSSDEDGLSPDTRSPTTSTRSRTSAKKMHKVINTKHRNRANSEDTDREELIRHTKSMNKEKRSSPPKPHTNSRLKMTKIKNITEESDSNISTSGRDTDVDNETGSNAGTNITHAEAIDKLGIDITRTVAELLSSKKPLTGPQ